MISIFSCRYDRSVFNNPLYGMPPAVSDYEVATPSPWTRPTGTIMPVTNIPGAGFDWKTQPLPPGLYGGPAGSMPLPVGEPGSESYAIAQSWNEGRTALERVFGPNAVAQANAGIANGVSYSQAGAPVTSSGALPVSGGVLTSPMWIPRGTLSDACAGPTGCRASGLAGFGAVEMSNADLAFIVDRPQPSIVHQEPPLVIAEAPQDPLSDAWCRFARWVDANPVLATAGVAAFWFFKGKK